MKTGVFLGKCSNSPKISTNCEKNLKNPYFLRRKSQAGAPFPLKTAYGSPKNLGNRTGNPQFSQNSALFLQKLQKPALQNLRKVAEKPGNSQISAKIAKEKLENAICFTDVSQYKTNLIEFFRAEEQKQKNRENSAKKSDAGLKGIIKTSKKIEEMKTFGEENARKPRPSVYLRFQDQVIENPGNLLKKAWFLCFFLNSFVFF